VSKELVKEVLNIELQFSTSPATCQHFSSRIRFEKEKIKTLEKYTPKVEQQRSSIDTNHKTKVKSRAEKCYLYKPNDERKKNPKLAIEKRKKRGLSSAV